MRIVLSVFCGKLKSDLFFLSEKAQVNSVLYEQTVIEPQLVTFAHQVCKKYGWVGIVENSIHIYKGAARR